ncbi:MAG: endonuclease/exonuclease/phosphatase family protein, partial [Candidatus Fonsibacter sp.]
MDRGLRLVSWNVRWLVSPHSPQGIAKKARIQRALAAGKMVLLQETHWDEQAAGIWGGLFPGTRVQYSVDRSGRQGRQACGVAVLILARYTLLSCCEVVPGCCIEARVCLRDTLEQERTVWTVQCMYFPPDSRGQDVGEYTQWLQQHGDGSFYAAGDLNLQVHDPRCDAEVSDLERLQDAWHQVGARPVPSALATRRGGGGQVTLDHWIVPVGLSFDCKVLRQWTGESDHAWLELLVGLNGGDSQRRCSPAALD